MRIGMIGNCQVQSMALAASLMLDEPEITVFDYSESYSRAEAERLSFAESLSDADLIFCQRAALSHTNEDDLRDRYGDKVVVVANFYFRGLFPDSCYVGDFEHRLSEPMAVNSILVLDAFRRGLSEREALGAFAVDNMQRLGLLDAWESSMTEMRAREGHGMVDVPAADMLEEACRRYPAFLTMNHPSLPFLADYMQLAFRHAGLRTRHLNPLAVQDPLAVHDTTPILDEVAGYFGLPYRTTQSWKVNSREGAYMGREDYVAAFYGTYETTARAQLLVHSPTDLVARLRGDPALAYLVDSTAAVPRGGASGLRPAGGAENGADLVRGQIERAVDGLRRELSRTADRQHAQAEQHAAALRETMQVGQDRMAALEAALAGTMAETQVYIHRVHSFLEIADPKVERIDHTLATLSATVQASRAQTGRLVRMVAANLVALVLVVLLILAAHLGMFAL